MKIDHWMVYFFDGRAIGIKGRLRYGVEKIVFNGNSAALPLPSLQALVDSGPK